SGWNETLTHWAITLGDQPHLQFETLCALLDFSSLNPDHICQPSHGGRPRHPVLLPRRLFQELASTSRATLKEFLAEHRDPLRLIESSDPGLDLDLDTPADYEEARRRFT